MKLVLKVVLINNMPAMNTMEYTFDEQGGNIGRDPLNHWVLPDKQKYLSRTHATIEYAHQTFYLLNTSTNGIFLNDDIDSLSTTQKLTLEQGMHLTMGDYTIEVSIIASPEIELSPPSTPDPPIIVSDPPNTPNTEHLIMDDFLRGAGLNQQDFTETLAQQPTELAGRLFRIAIEGIMDVLQSRHDIKQGMQMDVTMAQHISNNPIKFAITADDALQRLFTEQPQAFLSPEQALSEVFDDIKAHQIAVITGIQASFIHVLHCFEPKKLMKRLEKENPVSAVIPVQRQAKLWEKFEELYDVIEEEIEEDFNHLFRQAFVKAYDEQIKKLKAQETDE